MKHLKITLPLLLLTLLTFSCSSDENNVDEDLESEELSIENEIKNNDECVFGPIDTNSCTSDREYVLALEKANGDIEYYKKFGLGIEVRNDGYKIVGTVTNKFGDVIQLSMTLSQVSDNSNSPIPHNCNEQRLNTFTYYNFVSMGLSFNPSVSMTITPVWQLSIQNSNVKGQLGVGGNIDESDSSKIGIYADLDVTDGVRYDSRLSEETISMIQNNGREDGDYVRVKVFISLGCIIPK